MKNSMSFIRISTIHDNVVFINVQTIVAIIEQANEPNITVIRVLGSEENIQTHETVSSILVKVGEAINVYYNN